MIYLRYLYTEIKNLIYTCLPYMYIYFMHLYNNVFLNILYLTDKRLILSNALMLLFLCYDNQSIDSPFKVEKL